MLALTTVCSQGGFPLVWSDGYDRRGNPVRRTFGGIQASWSWSYDAENQLTRVQTNEYYTPEASRWKVEFVYDGGGRLRVKRDYTWDTTYNQWYLSAETRYLYDGLLLVQERSSANSPTVTYTRGRDLSGTLAGAGGIGGLLARSHGYSAGNWSSHNFYHADGNGNVTALVNGSGALQASYKYDPYGRYLSGGGSLASANGLRFSSKPWVGFAGSTSSGLYYYGYRFYDPYLQRWINRDPIGEIAGINLYSFVRSDPAGSIDLHGLDIYVTPGIHPRVIGDKPWGGCYSIEFTIPPGTVYWIWNPGYYLFGEWSLPSSAVTDLKKCVRIPTCPETDRILYNTARSLGQSLSPPRYNLFEHNCRDFVDNFCAVAKNLNFWGIPYDPRHSRINAPPTKVP
jgi:RHS repeat-associated protein